MAEQTISNRALKRLAAEHGETRLLLFDAQEKLGEAQQQLTALTADNAKLTTERDDLKATVERLMGGRPGAPDDGPELLPAPPRPRRPDGRRGAGSTNVVADEAIDLVTAPARAVSDA